MTSRTSCLTHPALALLVAAALGACGNSYQDHAENDSGAATGAGSANGTSIGQTPGYGGKGYAAPGTGGAMSDTTAAGGPLPPSGGINSPNAAAAAAGQRDTVGGGSAAGRTSSGAGPSTPTGNTRGTTGATGATAAPGAASTAGPTRDSARAAAPPRP